MGLPAPLLRGHTSEESLVAVVSGTKSENVAQVLKGIDAEECMKVREVPLGLSRLMRRIVPIVCSKAKRVTDRFRIRKMACDVKSSMPQS